MRKRERVAIIGGGVTGLTAAFTLECETDLDITLFESSDHLGGKIRTDHSGGFTIEEGPDSVFAGKPAALELIHELGLDDQIVEPQAKGFYLLLNNRLHSVPAGLASLGGISAAAIEHAGFLTQEGKERALAEPSIPPAITADESISHFFGRRFGDEFSRLVAEPILAGTHAGDPSRLSMRALYPHYLDREAEHGSLVAQAHSIGRPIGPAFLSFRNGMATLSEGLRKSLRRAHVITSAPLAELELGPDGFVLPVDAKGSSLEFSRILLAIPADDAALLIRPHLPDTAYSLDEIEFASSAIVTVAYHANSLPGELCGTGFLAPFDEEQVLTGCTWSSSKWPDRAPEDQVLLRFFYGGDGRPPVADLSDEDLIAQTRANASGILGIEAEPTLKKVSHWNNALPQYALGHTALVDQIEESLEGTRFTVAGSSYRGVGIPDCIRQGRDAARKIAKELG